MKNVITATAIALLFGLNACKNVDEKLVTEMQQSTTVLEKSKPAGDSAAMKIEQLRTLLSNVAPEKAPAAKYVSNRLSQKLDLILLDYNSAKEELQNLLSDYQDGKIKKEEADAKHKALLSKIENYEKAFDKIGKVAQRPTEDLIKMGEDMAKQEGLDLSKPVSQDMIGDGNNIKPAGGTGADGGTTVIDGAAKKKDGGK